MAKVDITERDLLMLQNVPKILNKAKIELSGNEVIQCAQTLQYLGGLIALFEKELQPKPQSPLATAGSVEKAEPVQSEEKKPSKKRGRPKKSVE
jgi:hypothetical protein